MTNESNNREIEEIWSDDKLERYKAAELYTSFLDKQYDLLEKKHFVLNIDSSWGGGKSFFITRWAKTLELQRHPCITYDAWSNDYTRDPMLSLLGSVINGLEQYIEDESSVVKEKLTKAKLLAKKVFLKSAPIAIPAATLALFGIPIPNPFGSEESTEEPNQHEDSEGKKLIGDLSKLAVDSMLSKDSSRDAAIKDFKDAISELVEEISASYNMPLFIFIDELDRCRPDFAIDLIECVKHIFDIENIFFIFGTDGKQLQASISSKYGQEFDAEVYFKRIFNREFELPSPDLYSFTNMLFSKTNLKGLSRTCFLIPAEILCEKPQEADDIVYLLALLSEHFDLELRDIEQCFNCFSAFMIARNKPTNICYAFFLVVLWHKDKALFKEYSKSRSKYDFLFKNVLPALGNPDTELSYEILDRYSESGQHRVVSVNVIDCYSEYAKYHDLPFATVYDQAKIAGYALDANIQSLLQAEIGNVISLNARLNQLDISRYPREISQLG